MANRKRVAIYTRVSKATGADEESTPRQEKQCRALAESKGWEVTKVFTDKGISGWNGAARPNWLKLEDAVRGDEIDAVIVMALSRAGRNTGKLLAFLEECREHGVDFVSATEGIDTGTSMGKVIFTILGAVAELESAMKSERQVPAKAEAKAKGAWLGGGRRPYGYRSHVNGDRKTEWDIDKDEAKVIRDLASRVIAGESVNAVTLRLNEQGVVTSGGNRWRPAHVKRLLERQLPSAVFPAILKPDVAEVVAATLKNREQKQGRPSDARSFVLNGLVICDQCDTKMIGSREVRKDRDGKTYEQYRCTVRAGGCNETSIGALPLERWFTDALADENERRGAGWVVTKTTPVANDKVIASLKALDKREVELGDALADGRLSMTVVEKSLSQIKTEREQLREQLRETTTQPVEGTMTVGDKEWPMGKAVLTLMFGSWFNRTLPAAKAMELHDHFATVVKEIRVRPKASRSETPADRCTVTWK